MTPPPLPDKLEIISSRYDEHRKLFDSDDQSDDVKVWAWAYWKKWHHWMRVAMQLASDAEKMDLTESQSRLAECEGHKIRQGLCWAYEAAVAWLMREAERRGIDSTDLAKCKPMVRDAILSPNQVRYRFWSGSQDWPELIGDELYELPETLQKAILESTATFDRLVARLEIDMLGVSGILSPDENTKWVRLKKGEAAKKLDADFVTLKRRAAKGQLRMKELAGTRDVLIHPDDIPHDDVP